MKGLIIALVALGCVGGGYYVFDMTQRTHQAELKKAEAELRLKAKAEDAKKAQAEAKAAEDARKKAEADSKKSEAEKEKAKLNAEATKKAIELKAKEKAASEAAAKQAEKEKAAAEAATKQANAEKARAEAAKAAAEAKAKEEELALKRAEAERKTAEAKRDETLAAAAIVKAATEKSENERKEAEANAAAERDRKLRLYSRASLSRAEMVALQRAERLLALEESGHLARARAEAGAEDESAPDEGDTAATDESTEAPETNAVVAVTWPPEKLPEPPDGEKVAALQKKLDDVRLREHVRGARRCVAVFGERIDRAVADGRLVDAQSDRRALVSLVPDYMDVYIDLIDEARKAGNETVQGKRLDELIALVPAWRRTALFVRLLTHDEAYFSRALAVRIEKNEYVRAFRKIYDVARRDKGDRDERDEKVEHICKVLATYVPDFETSPEWK